MKPAHSLGRCMQAWAQQQQRRLVNMKDSGQAQTPWDKEESTVTLQKEEAASQQQELDRVQRAYENLKAQERQLEESLSHISEEVKGIYPRSAWLRQTQQSFDVANLSLPAFSTSPFPDVLCEAVSRPITASG